MDSFSDHLTNKVKKEIGKVAATQAVIPDGSTLVLSVLVSHLKNMIHAVWINYVRGKRK